MSTRTYTIKPRAAELGGGWNMKLYEDGEEAGGGVFPLSPYLDEARELAEDSDKAPEEIAAGLAYSDAIDEGEGYASIEATHP